MWIKAAGQLTENVFQVTTAASSHLLIFGEASALVDSGISALHEQLKLGMEEFLNQGEALTYILLTHAHFDHVGGIPYLRRHYPNLEVVGSPLTNELLTNESYRKQLYEANKRCDDSFDGANTGDLLLSETEWKESLRIDQIVGEGDSIELGAGVDIKIVGCAGHTADCLAYFVRPDGALQGGECIGGYHGRDTVSSCFTASYEQYLASLDKLASLELKAIGLPHAGALTGELANKYLLAARQEAERAHALIKERLEQGELVEDIAATLVTEWKAEGRVPEGPFYSALQTTVREMVGVVAAGHKS